MRSSPAVEDTDRVKRIKNRKAQAEFRIRQKQRQAELVKKEAELMISLREQSEKAADLEHENARLQEQVRRLEAETSDQYTRCHNESGIVPLGGNMISGEAGVSIQPREGETRKTSLTDFTSAFDMFDTEDWATGQDEPANDTSETPKPHGVMSGASDASPEDKGRYLPEDGCIRLPALDYTTASSDTNQTQSIAQGWTCTGPGTETFSGGHYLPPTSHQSISECYPVSLPSTSNSMDTLGQDQSSTAYADISQLQEYTPMTGLSLYDTARTGLGPSVPDGSMFTKLFDQLFYAGVLWGQNLQAVQSLMPYANQYNTESQFGPTWPLGACSIPPQYQCTGFEP